MRRDAGLGRSREQLRHLKERSQTDMQAGLLGWVVERSAAAAAVCVFTARASASDQTGGFLRR